MFSATQPRPTLIATLIASAVLATACGGGLDEEDGHQQILARRETALKPTGSVKTTDTIAPAISVASQSSVTADGHVSVGGSATDNVAVKNVTWSNSNGTSGQATLTGSGTAVTWNANGMALTSGDNTVTFTVQDTSANKATTKLTVNYQPPVEPSTGGTGSSTTPPPSPSPSPTPATSIDSSDVVYNLDPGNLESYRYATLACYGANRYWWDWGGTSGYYLAPAAFPVATGTGEVRGDVVADPDNAFGKAFVLAAGSMDPDTSTVGGKRCEMSLGWTEYTYPGRLASKSVSLPRNRDFWWTIQFRLGDWLATTDRQVVFQWLSPSASTGPFMSLEVWGSTMRLQLQSDASPTPSTSTLVRTSPWSKTDWQPNHWYTAVIKARIDSTTPSNGHFTMWIDGTQVVDYAGVVGYPATPAQDYAKFGIYHWTGATNVWSSSVPVRTAHFKGPAYVFDRAGYDAAMVSGIIH